MHCCIVFHEIKLDSEMIYCALEYHHYIFWVSQEYFLGTGSRSLQTWITESPAKQMRGSEAGSELKMMLIFFKKIGAHMSFCEAIDTLLLDFWWCLLWVSKPWDSPLVHHLLISSDQHGSRTSIGGPQDHDLPCHCLMVSVRPGRRPTDLAMPAQLRWCKIEIVRFSFHSLLKNHMKYFPTNRLICFYYPKK